MDPVGTQLENTVVQPRYNNRRYNKYIYIYIYQEYFSNSEETQAPVFTWHHHHESFFQL